MVSPCRSEPPRAGCCGGGVGVLSGGTLINSTHNVSNRQLQDQSLSGDTPEELLVSSNSALHAIVKIVRIERVAQASYSYWCGPFTVPQVCISFVIQGVLPPVVAVLGRGFSLPVCGFVRCATLACEDLV